MKNEENKSMSTVKGLTEECNILRSLLEPVNLPFAEKDKLVEGFVNARVENSEQELLEAANSFFLDDMDSASVMNEIPEDGIFHIGEAYFIFGDGIERHVETDFHLYGLKWMNYIDGELVLEEPRKYIDEVILELRDCSYDDIIRNCVNEGSKRYGKVRCLLF